MRVTRPIEVDLYSDTLTKPTAAMFRLMGPPWAMSRRGGPTVNQLQDMVAELLGKEVATHGQFRDRVIRISARSTRRSRRASPRRAEGTDMPSNRVRRILGQGGLALGTYTGRSALTGSPTLAAAGPARRGARRPPG